MSFFDFTLDLLLGHPSSSTTGEGVANLFGANRFIPVDGLSAEARVQQMCPPLSRQLPSKKVPMIRAVSWLGQPSWLSFSLSPIKRSIQEYENTNCKIEGHPHNSVAPQAHRCVTCAA